MSYVRVDINNEPSRQFINQTTILTLFIYLFILVLL